MKYMRLAFVAIMLSMVGCVNLMGGIQDVTVVQKAPPNTGNVDVRVGSESRGKFLFEVKFSSGMTGGLPSQGLMDDMIAEGKRRGANVLTFECASPGTVGASRCNMKGYFE
jgi:hypothetical protein